MNKIEIRAQHNFYADCTEIYIVENRDGKRFIATNVEFAELKEGEQHNPTLVVHSIASQRLANDLWSAGCRPEQSKQSQGAMEAKSAHLEDMRALAFSKLNVEKP